jgi:hypothetical protein
MPERVIAAFPATGKTFYAEHTPGVIDSDSSRFSWSEPGVRHPDWPENYVRHIAKVRDSGATVLVSTHAEVRDALAVSAVPFTLVYPDPWQREDYRKRMEQRGSPPALIAKVIDELWDDAIDSCAVQMGCEHIQLRRGQYLSDVLSRATASAPQEPRP